MLAAAWLAAASHVAVAQGVDPLRDGFRDPPASARPRTWWHWLNGNITEDGITKDLEWMKRVGLGGVQTFDASLGTPQVVPQRLIYMSPPWKAAFAHAVDTANRLGLEIAIASSPGWSETGGPWVPPADAMKKLVWSELEVQGGRKVAAPLPPLPANTGPYGTAPFFDALAAFEGGNAAPKGQAAGAIAVLAYPIADASLALPNMTAQDGKVLDARLLVDAREDTAVAIPRGTAAQPAMIDIAFPKAQPIRAVTLFVPNAVPPFGDPEFLPTLEAQVAGQWKQVATLPLTNVPTTIAFAPITAGHFRLVFAANHVPPAPGLAPPAPGAIAGGVFPSGPAPTTISIGTLRLAGEERIDRFEAKAGFATVPDYYALASDAPDEPGIAPARVIDISDRLKPDGRLDWTPPAGRWRIVRLGWSLVGTTNHPATHEATGLEVDKYDGAAVRRYLATYLDTYRDQLRADGSGINALVTDSIEAGDANWTPQMLDAFKALRGYDPRPWLPALTGAVVGSRVESDRFLYDYRRTLADLLAREHYGTIGQVAHDHKLTLYGEALENGRPQLGDDLAMRSHADVPMAAMWAFPHGGTPRPTLVGDVLGAASVAHVYGRPVVAAESFTSSFSPWAYAPVDLKPIADLEFVLGVSRPVVHTSPHSPMDDKEPGLSLAIFGQFFNRHETWAEMARPWVDYLARSSFLLQQGSHVADIAYFHGEEAPLTALFLNGLPDDLPIGRGFDFVDADMIDAEMRVDGREIVTPAGAHYRALYLGGTSARMTLPTLRHIAALIDAGATVVGKPPRQTPSLGDDPAAFAALVKRLWPQGTAQSDTHRAVIGDDAGAVLTGLGIGPDVAVSGADPADVPFQHRATTDGDIYFLVNRAGRPLDITARFRVGGRAAEIWHADSGTVAATTWRQEGAVTAVPLHFAPEEALFVVFRRPTPDRAQTVVPPIERTIATAAAPWRISFQANRGAPAELTLPALAPLNEQAQSGVRYFSGVAHYASTLAVPRRTAGTKLLLDLGRVGDVAEVRVNGRSVGTLWHAPYRIDIGAAAHKGANLIEVNVANLWANRLIGDAQPGVTKVAFVAAPTYLPDAPLRPSGLIGPVTLIEQR
ncbi:glycoside hydrolase [Sphingomonas nostoxanthinifaciens]|nr:glycoside hydrolase [Sphingomonas nostoxanthinifaciens]